MRRLGGAHACTHAQKQADRRAAKQREGGACACGVGSHDDMTDGLLPMHVGDRHSLVSVTWGQSGPLPVRLGMEACCSRAGSGPLVFV